MSFLNINLSFLKIRLKMFGKLCRKKEVPRTKIKFPKHVNSIPVEEAPSVNGYIASMRSAPKFPQKPPPGNISDEPIRINPKNNLLNIPLGPFIRSKDVNE